MSTIKKVLVSALSLSLMAGNVITAFAAPDASGTGTGSAELEYVNTDVYSATVPTDANIGKIATYSVDTEGLVKASDHAKYADATDIDDSKGVMFQNYNDDFSKTVGLSPVSDPIVITNKSSDPIDVKLDIQVTALGDITKLANSDDFIENSDSEMYLAYYADEAWKKALTTAASDVTTYDVLATAEEFYKVGYSSNAYTYAIDNTVTADKFPVHKFYLTGAANFAKTFTKDVSGTATPKTLPTIKVAYTINLNKNMDAQAEWSGEELWFTNKSGTLPADKAISGIKIDGKDVTISNVKSGSDGWASITWEQIYKAYDATWTSADKVPESFNPTHIEFACDGVTYIAPIK